MGVGSREQQRFRTGLGLLARDAVDLVEKSARPGGPATAQLRAGGLQAPEALSLVGFDDASYADFTQPRISTIRQPARELGRTAVNIMMRLLNDDPDIPAETRLPVEWIGRDSIKIC